MDEKQFELVLLSGLSAGLGLAAVIYDQWLATAIFAALASGTAVIAMRLRRLH
jgi:hypothetical protein